MLSDGFSWEAAGMAPSHMIKPNTVITIAFFASIGFSPFMGPFTSPIRF
jgi:hypothetical protein